MDLYQYALYRCKADNGEVGVFSYVVVNAQRTFEYVYSQVLLELRECLLELCNGAFTFDYSYHLSRNVQARMKKLRFNKRNLEQNIDDFIACFTQEQIEATIVEEALQRLIYGVKFSYQHRFNTADSRKDEDYRVSFCFDASDSTLHLYEQQKKDIA
jgi:hypothetical protein